VIKKIKYIISEEITKLNEIEVFHGTDLNFHQFDLNKIGSGDGRSLGGWGIYFSDNPDVSKQYITNKGKVKKYELKRGNFFDLDDYLSSGSGHLIFEGLKKRNDIDDSDLLEFEEDFISYENDISNAQALEWLTYVLGGDKEVSEFLHTLGYDGNMFHDKTIPTATNYVIYNTNIIKYVDNDEDDILNEDFNNILEEIKQLSENGELTTEYIMSILNSNNFSNGQKEKIKSIINIEKIDNPNNEFNVNHIKDLFKKNKLFGEFGNNDEFNLKKIIKNNPNQKFVVFSAITNLPITSKIDAIATANENNYKTDNSFIFFEKQDDEKIKSYVIIPL